MLVLQVANASKVLVGRYISDEKRKKTIINLINSIHFLVLVLALALTFVYFYTVMPKD